eukprot:3921243-Amphidinium_carterae.1
MSEKHHRLSIRPMKLSLPWRLSIQMMNAPSMDYPNSIVVPIGLPRKSCNHATLRLHDRLFQKSCNYATPGCMTESPRGHATMQPLGNNH